MKNNGMLTRIISGVVLAIGLAFVGIAGGLPLFIATAVAGVIGLFELYKALSLYNKNAEKKLDNVLAITGITGSIIYFFALGSGIMTYLVCDLIDVSGLEDSSIFEIMSDLSRINKVSALCNMSLILIFIVCMFVVFMGIYVFTFPHFTFEKIAYALVSVVYVPVLLSFMYMIRSQENGKYVFWLIFISSWVCDTCAYFVGSAMGKHKLAPVLSPKKSIEGAIGGIVGSVIVAFILGYLVEYKMFGGINHTVVYMIICAFGAVVSQIGDLAASGIKRNHNIKDYGDVIPGHGGILDRFDSVIFVSPVIYILSVIIM